MSIPPTTWIPPRRFSRFAAVLLAGGLITFGTGANTIWQAKSLEDHGQVLPAVVTKVGERQGRFIPITYRYEAPGPDGRPKALEKTVMAHHSRVEKWGEGRKVEALAYPDKPEDSNLVENKSDFASGMQWVLFGATATFFGAIRLRGRREEA